MNSVIFWLIIIFIIVVGYTDYRPYIDRTSNGSVVIWFNWNGKRVFKYLWKQKEN
jgi:hypothetical protein